MSLNKEIAIIGSGEMAVILVENAKKMGLKTHTFSNNLCDRVVGYSDVHHNFSIFEVDEIVEVCAKLGVCGVLPTTELTVSIAAIVANRLNLNGMSVDVAMSVTDKGYVREKAKMLSSVKQPAYCIWTVGEEFPKVDQFPVVVKPTAMGGKRGVSVAFSQEEMRDAIAYAVENMPKTKNKIIIEEFIGGGKEYSVEGLSYHGQHTVIQVTEKITSGPPHCVELGHLQPAPLPVEIRKKIDSAIPELLAAVGVDNTTSHTEIKVVDGEIYLIELNARSGGDHIAYPLTEISTGYPYIQGAIQVAMDTYTLPDVAKFRKNVCGVIFVAEQTKEFSDLFNQCEQFPWLYKKSQKSEELVEIVNNQSFDTNYFIFTSQGEIPVEIADLLRKRESL